MNNCQYNETMHTMYIAIFNLNQIYITLWFEDAAYK